MPIFSGEIGLPLKDKLSGHDSDVDKLRVSSTGSIVANRFRRYYGLPEWEKPGDDGIVKGNQDHSCPWGVVGIAPNMFEKDEDEIYHDR